MDYEKFVAEVAEKMRLHYKRKGLDYEVAVRRTDAVNREPRMVIIVCSPGMQSDASPAFYMEQCYQLFREGMEVKEIAERMADLFEEKLQSLDGSTFDKERIMTSLRMELIHAERNSVMLSKLPHRLVVDLALIYQFVVSRNEEELCSSILTNRHMKELGVTEEDLFQAAMEYRNTNAPYVIQSMKEIVEEEMPEEELEEIQKSMTVLSTKDHFYGASCILYPEVVEELSSILGEDFLLLPCSIHEWIVLPERFKIDLPEVEQFIERTNQDCLQEADVLSDHVYYYDTQKHELLVHEGGQEQNVSQLALD